jgi:formyl-CoA transferase
VRKVTPARAPELGEHSADILRDLGFSGEEVKRLAAAGTVLQQAEQAGAAPLPLH